MADGRKLALSYDRLLDTLGPEAKKWGAAVLLAYVLAPYTILPLAMYALYARAGKAVYDYIKSQGSLSKDDANNIDMILEAGRKAGVQELEVEVSKERFEGMRAKLAEPKSGLNVEVGAGAAGSGKYVIKARYWEPKSAT